jgi:Putative  PD-(D/E)XK family member, (DUF4420)
MSSPQLPDLLRRLIQTPSGHAYTLIAIPPRSDVWLAADAAGRPSIFVRSQDASLVPSLRTSHVSLHLGQSYTVADIGGQGRVERFDALKCEATNQKDAEAFLLLAEAFLTKYAREPIDRAKLVGFFRSMVRLFSTSQASDLKRERQGLWGELFMMRTVRGTAFWAPSWHSEATRKFDFSVPRRHVEVKTTVGDERIHPFSHRQIYALEGEEILIASLLLRPDDSGMSLRDLIIEARQALRGTDEYFKLEEAVRQTGMEALDEPGPAYDEAEAAKSLGWYRATDAPHFTMPEPSGVSQTHYRVDLANAPQIAAADLATWLGSWAVLAPRQAS